jgi:hypothetical protein
VTPVKAACGTTFDVAYWLVLASGIYVLVRSFYSRYLKKKEVQEGKKAVTEWDVMRIFDLCCVAAICPLILRDGVGVAMKIWSVVSFLTSLVTKSMSGLNIISRLFKDDDDDDAETIIGSALGPIATATRDLQQRVERNLGGAEHQQASGGISPDVTRDTNDLFHDTEEMKSFPPPNAAEVPVETPIGKKCGEKSKQQLEFEKKFPKFKGFVPANHVLQAVPEEPVSPYWDGLYAIWDGIEDKVHLNAIKEKSKKAPWILPVILIVLFAFILVLTRFTKREPEKVKCKSGSKCRRKDCSFAHPEKVVEEGKASDLNRMNRRMQKQKSNGKQHQRKPWIDYEFNDQSDELVYVDELGDTYRRIGRKAERHGTEFAINNMSNEYGGDKRIGFEEAHFKKFKESKSLHNRFEKVKPAVDDVLVAFPSTFKIVERQEGVNYGMSLSSRVSPKKKEKVVRCSVKNCDKKCGNYHDVKREKKNKSRSQKKVLDKKHKDQKTPPKQEGASTGPRFEVGKVLKSVGWATVTGDTGSMSMCCTIAFNCIIVCAHIFRVGGDLITFRLRNVDGTIIEIVRKRSQYKKIGWDLYAFRLPQEHKFHQLRGAQPSARDVVFLPAYNSKDSFDKNEHVVSDGVIRTVINVDDAKDVDGSVKATKCYYTASSVDGNCSAPVCNRDGKLVALHNAGANGENVCLAVTVEMLKSLNVISKQTF